MANPISSKEARIGGKERSFMFCINSTTTRTQGWQEDCWNWAKAHEPFELHGVATQHLPFCEALAAACKCQFHSHHFHGNPVTVFEPADSIDRIPVLPASV